jgi:16S rRNA (uracil1498-N3)-methyltransferase
MRDRFFVEGVHTVGDVVAFAADDARKLTTVLRKRSGDRVQVVDSGGVAFAATLGVEGREGRDVRVHATLDDRLDRGDVETALRVTIAQAVPKGQKMDLVVEKATELGARGIVPVRSARVIGHDTSAAKVERWRRIARSAAQQSGRLRVPDVAGVHDWDALLATFAEYDRVYVPWELAEPAPLRDLFERDLAEARSVLVIIGPEGGLSSTEIDRARAAGAQAISLGRRILRTETAALVVVAPRLKPRGRRESLEPRSSARCAALRSSAAACTHTPGRSA